MSYTVTGALAVVTDSAGKLRYLYQGSPVPDDIADVEVSRLVESGLVTQDPEIRLMEPDEPTGPLGPSDPVDVAGGDDERDVARPPQVAPKADWVDYAVSRGASRNDAEVATKAELIERYGG